MLFRISETALVMAITTVAAAITAVTAIIAGFICTRDDNNLFLHIDLPHVL